MNGLYIGFPIEDYSAAKSLAEHLATTTGVRPTLGTMQLASESQDAAALISSDLALFILSTNSVASKEEIAQIHMAEKLSKMYSFVILEGTSLSGEIDALSCRSDRIHLSDPRQVDKLISNVRSLFTKQDFFVSGNNLNGHPLIDMGLDTLWSECNLGSPLPDVGGDYFAWGETVPKDRYSWFTYAFEPKDRNLYEVLEEEEDVEHIGFVRYDCFDMKVRLGAVDDAATRTWGDPWRIPTADEFKEVIENCDGEWVEQRCDPDAHDYGRPVIGLRLTSRINGNILFLPAAGYKYYDDQDGTDLLVGNGTVGAYQSSDRDETSPHEACYLYFDKGRRSIRRVTREIGLNIRPVVSRSALKKKG